MHDTGLADRIRAKGVTVVEVAGWQTRGASASSGGTPFQPRGAVHHHTAGSANGTVPSLNTCIYGRPDVPGPLCQVLQSREADPSNDKAYVIAAGKANHGGEGSWTGNSGTVNSNYESEGLEVEHVGSGSVDADRHEISARILAAMMEAPGSTRDASMVCEHYEYALPPGRKVDFRELNPPFAGRGDEVRARVKYWIGRNAEEGDWFDMATEAELSKIVHDQNVAVNLRSSEATQKRTDDPWKHNIPKLDHPAETVLADARIIARRAEEAALAAQAAAEEALSILKGSN